MRSDLAFTIGLAICIVLVSCENEPKREPFEFQHIYNDCATMG